MNTALFTIAKKQRLTKCLTIDKWVSKIQYPYNGILFNKKNELHDSIYMQYPE
jgi:hypothetical protein